MDLYLFPVQPLLESVQDRLCLLFIVIFKIPNPRGKQEVIHAREAVLDLPAVP